MAHSYLPNLQYVCEMKRPWKLISFTIGMIWLIYGAVNYQISDWDIGVSLLMGGLTYLCAPWSIRVILLCLRDRPRYWGLWIIAALAVAWAVIDGVYFGYHYLADNMMYRAENLFASAALYFLAGSIWLYRGSIRDFARNVRSIFIGRH